MEIVSFIRQIPRVEIGSSYYFRGNCSQPGEVARLAWQDGLKTVLNLERYSLILEMQLN